MADTIVFLVISRKLLNGDQTKKTLLCFYYVNVFPFLKSIASVGEKKDQQQSANVYLVATKNQNSCQKILEEIIYLFKGLLLLTACSTLHTHSGPLDQFPWTLFLYVFIYTYRAYIYIIDNEI